MKLQMVIGIYRYTLYTIYFFFYLQIKKVLQVVYLERNVMQLMFANLNKLSEIRTFD